MKKIISLIIMFVYILSVSTIAHADSMGFFDHEGMGGMDMGHCGWHEKSSNKSDKGNVVCCDLAFSNEYSDAQLKQENFTKVFLPQISNKINYNITTSNIKLHKLSIVRSPGGRADIKYKQFSDLIGIIVNLG